MMSNFTLVCYFIELAAAARNFCIPYLVISFLTYKVAVPKLHLT